MTEGSTPQEHSESESTRRLRSDKCDFRMPAGPGSLQATRIESAKCDWHVATPALQARGTDPATVEDLQARTVAGRLRMDSDKCDWRVRIDDVATRTVQAQTLGPELELRTSAGPVRGELGSSKCDWSIQMLGARPGMKAPPQLRADLSSDKCDFAMRVQIGLQGGPSWSLRAAGSDKCDFRVELPEQDRPVEPPGRSTNPGSGS
jgi:hypothetical protein